MHRTLSGRAVLAALTLTASCALSTAWSSAPALAAAGGSGSCSSSGGSSGGGGGSGIDYKIWVALNTHESMCSGGGNVQSDGSAGTAVHIACWWASEYSPAGLQSQIESFASQGSTSNWYVMLKEEYDKNGTDPADADYKSTDGPPWESYNVGASPGGSWYGLIYNTDDTLAELQKCSDEETARGTEVYFWGVNGNRPPDLPNNLPGFTEQDLALYLDDVIELPDAVVGMNPPRKSTVNVPVWYWQNASTNSLTIDNICAFGVCVNFTAQAVKFTILTAGAPASMRDSSCTLNTNTGVLGQKYTKADGNTASNCGVTYTAPGTGKPAVRTYWHVSITWPGGNWSPLRDGYIDTTLGTIPVQEIQAVNPTVEASH